MVSHTVHDELFLFIVTKKDVPKAIPPAIEANATEVVMILQPKQLFTNLRRCIKNGIAIP